MRLRGTPGTQLVYKDSVNTPGEEWNGGGGGGMVEILHFGKVFKKDLKMFRGSGRKKLAEPNQTFTN